MSLNFLTYYLNSSISVWRSLVSQIVGMSHLWFLYLRLLGKGLQLNISILLLFMVSNIFENLVNNRTVDQVEKCALFSDFQYDLRSSESTTDLLRVVNDKTARVFNRYGAIWVVALDMSKTFDRLWHAGLLHKLDSYGVSGQICGLISSFLSNRWLHMVLNEKSSWEHLVNSRVSQGSILGPTISLLHINDLPDDAICYSLL